MTAAQFWLKKNDSSKSVINEISESHLVQINKALPLQEGNIKSIIDGVPARIVKSRTAGYTIFAIAFDKDRIKSKKILEVEVAVMLSVAEEFEVSLKSAAKRAEDHTRRLIHNLKSLTAKTMQEIFYIARQDTMLQRGKQAVDYMRDEVSRNPGEAAAAFLEILKYQAAQNAEFSAFHKLNGEVGQLKKEDHSVHKVLMNAFYLFFREFTDKGVTVDVEKTQLKAVFDYESMHVCIYHLVENASKYIMNGGKFSVSTVVKGGKVDVTFEMESLAIGSDEVGKIFQEGFSGRKSIEQKLNGSGVGLFVAKQLAGLNGCTLHVIPGIPNMKDPDYARNKFILSMPQ